MRQDLNFPIHSVTAEIAGSENYRGKKTLAEFTSKKVLAFSQGNNLYALPEFQKLDPENKLKVIIDGIGSEIDNKDHFYANTGSFSYGIDNWRRFITSL